MQNSIIRVYSHHYTVEPLDNTFRKAIMHFSLRFVISRPFRNAHGDVISEYKRIFAAAFKDRSIYRFHYNSFNDLIAFLKDRHLDSYDVINEPIPSYKTTTLKIKDKFSPRESQVPVLEYILNDVTI